MQAAQSLSRYPDIGALAKCELMHQTAHATSLPRNAAAAAAVLLVGEADCSSTAAAVVAFVLRSVVYG